MASGGNGGTRGESDGDVNDDDDPPAENVPEMKDETPAPWEDMDALTAGGGPIDDSDESDD